MRWQQLLQAWHIQKERICPNQTRAAIMLLQSPCVSSMRSSQHHRYLSHALRRHIAHHYRLPTSLHHGMVIPSGVGGVGRGQLPIRFNFCISLPSVQTVGRWRVFFYNFLPYFLFLFLFPFLPFLFFPFSFSFFLFVCASMLHRVKVNGIGLIGYSSQQFLIDESTTLR